MDPTSYIHDRVQSVGPLLLPAVRQVAASDEHGLELLPAGSCVLVWHRGKRFLLSAAHVVELYPDRAYYVGTATQWVEIPVQFRANVALGGHRETDPYDLAFCPVDDALASRLDGCRFLTADEIATQDVLIFDSPRRSKYLALGWPLNRFTMNYRAMATTTKNLAFTGALASRRAYGRVELSPHEHILLEFDRKEVVSTKGKHQAPSMDGMSGGGIFRMPSLDVVGSTELPRLAAITLEHRRREDLLVGLRIDLLLRTIDRDSGFAPVAV